MKLSVGSKMRKHGVCQQACKGRVFQSENNYIDPQYEEMAEGFEDNDEYEKAYADYLSYRSASFESTEIDGDVNVTSGGWDPTEIRRHLRRGLHQVLRQTGRRS